VRDAERLSSALNHGHAAVPLLIDAAKAMAAACDLDLPGDTTSP
jgi:hypothetical protein